MIGKFYGTLFFHHFLPKSECSAELREAIDVLRGLNMLLMNDLL